MPIAAVAGSLKGAIIDVETGEVLHEHEDGLAYLLSKVGKGNKRARRRIIRRYRKKVRRMARSTLIGVDTPRGNRWRVADCGRLPIPRREDVTVAVSNEGHAHLHGLVQCGHVWTCPVCASKVAGVRREEVKHALGVHLDQGRLAVSITLTVRHGIGHSCKQLLTAMDGAIRRLRANRRVQELQVEYGYSGQIRALEVTWGEANGWHPHFHLVWFFDTQLHSASTAEALQKVLGAAWVRAVETGGLPAPDAAIGCVVKRIEEARSYEAKGVSSIDGVEDWDAADELTRAIAKTANRGRYAPFDLLIEGRTALFREYALAFFGKRQLTWSPGLKARFALDDLTDEEVAADESKEGVAVLAVPHRDWLRAMKKREDLGCDLLELVEAEGAEAAVKWLRKIGLDARCLSPP